MKRYGKRLVIGTWVLALMTFLYVPASSAERKTIVGTVSDYYQIETDDGEVYDVVENEKGNALAEQMGRRVKVAGIVEDDEYRKIITILSYAIMEEEEQEEESNEEEVEGEGVEEEGEPEGFQEDVEEEEGEEEDVIEEEIEETESEEGG